MGVINRLNSVHSPVTEFLHRETALRVMQAGDRLGKCWFISMHLSFSPVLISCDDDNCILTSRLAP